MLQHCFHMVVNKMSFHVYLFACDGMNLLLGSINTLRIILKTQ